MVKNIFRKTALDNFSSPEQLDQLITVASPKGWVAVLSIGALILAALGWGIFGSIPTKVVGQGVLMMPGGIADVVADTSGRISMLYYGPGDIVYKGRIVARVAQPESVNRISSSLTKLSNLKAKYKLLVEQKDEKIGLELQSISLQKSNLEAQMAMLENRAGILQQRWQSQKELGDEGLITRQTALDTQFEMNRTKNEIREARDKLKRLDLHRAELEREKDWEINELSRQMKDAESEIEEQRRNLGEQDSIVSQHTGRVVEAPVEVGASISKGTTVLRLEPIGQNANYLAAVVYMPSSEGKKIRPGMEAEIAPTTVKREEYGSIRGRVWSVSEYAASNQAMMAVLKNETLVKELTAQGAPFEVQVLLNIDPTTPSGYEWSSSRGPDVELQAGARAIGSVVVYERRPIALIFPLFKKHILGIGE